MSLIKVVNEEPLVLECVINDYRLVVIPSQSKHNYGMADVKIENPKEGYKPSIFADYKLGTGMHIEAEDVVFEIQTTTYGSLPTEEIDKVVKGYKDAQSAVFMFNDKLERMLNYNK